MPQVVLEGIGEGEGCGSFIRSEREPCRFGRNFAGIVFRIFRVSGCCSGKSTDQGDGKQSSRKAHFGDSLRGSSENDRISQRAYIRILLSTTCCYFAAAADFRCAAQRRLTASAIFFRPSGVSRLTFFFAGDAGGVAESSDDFLGLPAFLLPLTAVPCERSARACCRRAISRSIPARISKSAINTSAQRCHFPFPQDWLRVSLPTKIVHSMSRSKRKRSAFDRSARLAWRQGSRA